MAAGSDDILALDKMKRALLLCTLILLCFTVQVLAEGSRESAEGTAPGLRKYVKMVIPGEYGSTQDQLIRRILPFIEGKLPFSVETENNPAFTLPEKNGSAWIGGNVSSYTDARSQDMHIFIAFEVPVVLAASPASPLVSFPDIFISPGDSSLLNCAVSPAAMRRENIDSPELRHIRFKETELVNALKQTIENRVPLMAALSVELTEMLRSGRLKGLAALSSSPLRIEGYGSIPSVRYWEKEYSPKPDYFGILLPDTTRPEILEAMSELWTERVCGSSELRAYAAGRGLIFNPRVIRADRR